MVFVHIFIDPDEVHRIMIIISIGNDAVTVYNMRYILAWRRSGWYPQYVIIRTVGISEASNQT